MQERYLAASPHNLVRVILGERHIDDNDVNNVYTRGAASFEQWIADGILKQDDQPAFYVYFQDFKVPESGESLTRKGFIGLGKVEDYSAGVVYRHEQTLSGPKKDRLQVLQYSRAHFGQIFMLYADQEVRVDQELDAASQGTPALDVTDEYGARHRVWMLQDAERIKRIQSLMEPMKLLIADGHHRYETSLNYRNEHPEDPAAHFTMMTFVNQNSRGLRILATHRVVSGLDKFSTYALLEKAKAPWQATPADSLNRLKTELAKSSASTIRIGVVTKDGFYLLTRPRGAGELDVPVLHQEILGNWLGIDEHAVRDEKNIQYVRGIEAAATHVSSGEAQAAFLLVATPIEEMARVAYSGGVMPQKSTDFYPKLLTGVTIYKL